jgi:hypothetical protein
LAQQIPHLSKSFIPRNDLYPTFRRLTGVN